jgi:ketosteroid isomerase-like protein
MSQENLETFKRGIEAYNRGDIEAVLEEHDPEVEWHPVLQVLLGGNATVYRGHEGVREFLRDTDDAFVELQIEVFDTRDLGDRLIATAQLRGRGKASGADTATPLSYLVDFRNGKVFRIWTFLDPAEALEAAGLPE